MTDQALDILKLVLLALLYLFFARVLWAVWSEVRQPTNARATEIGARPIYQPPSTPASPTPAGRRKVKPSKGRGGNPGRLVVIEPKERRGATFAITGLVGVGREPDNAIVITDDSYISSHHARISHHEGNVVVDDLGSKNGTYLNGTRLTAQRMIHPGDRVQIGYTVLEAQ